jgi:hypothetical protein
MAARLALALLATTSLVALPACSSLTRPSEITVAAEPLPSRALEAPEAGSGHVPKQKTSCE